jgi:tetratricopeptide (TPR) repeat protein
MRLRSICLLLLVAACSAPVEVPEPDLTGMEPRVVDALQSARAAVLGDAESAEAWGELGALYDAHLLTDLAVSCYRKAAELAPEEFEWAYLLAIARELQGAEPDEVVALFDRALSLRPDYAPTLVRLGDALWRRGRYDEARGELKRAVELAPQIAAAHRRLGQVALTQGDAQEAAKHMARAITLEPRDLAAYSGLSQALMRLGQAERARAIRERAEGLEPVTNLQDPVYAKRVFMRNVSSGGAFSRATAAIRDGDFAQAVQDLEIVLEIRPDDASARYWLGAALVRLGRNDAAIPQLTRAVEIEPAMRVAHLELARALAAEGRQAEALVRFDRAAEFEPLGPEDLYLRGVAAEAASVAPASSRQ